MDFLLKDVARDSMAFLPELVLCGVIVLLLLIRLFTVFDKMHLSGVALLGVLAAFVVSLLQWRGNMGLAGPYNSDSNVAASSYLFGGMLVYDHLTVYLRLFLYSFTALVIWLTTITGIPDRDDSSDFYVLLLGAVVGMSLMASSTHLLMIYIGVEMASLPSYALAGYLKGRRQSSEAALKYVVYGGGASGVMLYGISLLAGKYGTAYVPELAMQIVYAVKNSTAPDPILVLGSVFILVGVAFKLSAVPFHFWCPDVFEGASAEVAGFLSVASKGAALALLARFVLTLAGLDPEISIRPRDGLAVIRHVAPVLAFFAILTATFGNLAAFRQTNLKRLLAYSTIAHAGYMMMGLAVMTKEGVSAVLFYLSAYLFMNLGAFAVVAFLRNETKSEDLSAFRGLVRRSPWMVIAFCFFLLSLLGIPPLVGFAAKFTLFTALFHATLSYGDSGEMVLSYTAMTMIAFLALNTVLSAVYYLKVMRVMIVETRVEDVEGTEPTAYVELPRAITFVSLAALATLALGIFMNPLLIESDRGVERFVSSDLTPPAPRAALPPKIGAE